MGAQGFVIDALAPGGEAVLTYRYTVTADDIGGSVENTATVTLGEFSRVRRRERAPRPRPAPPLKSRP